MFRNMEEYIELAKNDIDVSAFKSRILKLTNEKTPIMPGIGLFQDDYPIHVTLDYLPLLESVLPLDFFNSVKTKKMFHSHDFFEMTYMYKGQFENHIEDKLYVHDNSAITLLNPFILHKFKPVHDDDLAINILMKTSIIEELYILLAEGDNKLYHFFFDSIYGPARKNYLLIKNDSEIENLIHGIVDEYM